MVDPITSGVLVNLIASAVVSVAGRVWTKVRGTPEGRTVKTAIGEALDEALRGAALPPGRAVDHAWMAQMENAWQPVFTANEVSQQLVASLADPSGERRFADAARQELARSGSDVEALKRSLWVDQFLAELPRCLWKKLNAAALREPAVRGLVNQVLSQRAEARASGVEPATPAELRSDLITLLGALDKQACSGRLPRYLPTGTDVTELSRTARVRPHVRHGPSGDDPGGQTDGGLYRLPVDRVYDSEPSLPWPRVAADYRRLVVLADPGLGKSWLVRTETHRLCGEALDHLPPAPGPACVPVPLRCDQLAAAKGRDLADKAAGFLVAQGLLAERSRGEVAAMVRSGEAVVLLDALDELTPAESGRMGELVRSWAEADEHARCVITSRIAGYTGLPLPGARVVELQAFTREDVKEAIKAWLRPAAAAQLLDRLANPATRSMARIPLLLALLCSLAAQATGGEALPATRGQLFERVLRWFLTGQHRRQDDPRARVRNDVEVEGLLRGLAPLAFTFATQPAGWTDLMPTGSLLDAIGAVPALNEIGKAGDVLRKLSVKAGVLVPDGDPSDGRSMRYLFLHRCVAEYLTARHLATFPEADRLDAVKRYRGSGPGWTEVITLLGECLAPRDARALIQYLLAAENDPHDALVTAARVWGERPDADQLLDPAQADELAGQLDDLFQDERTRPPVSSAYGAMTYLPQPVLTRLMTYRTEQDENLRRAAAEALAGREGPE